ncbi:DUF547 domain-containing protein [Marinihelvus fidelis]|uniref:DUF547 domain-containing protein n=1 Tax=Marinihelvus fidelis TaxID=2613842 RepID=A0A5N0T508_9GAMM|nr:DUF547 domain-containing protein [Marinihelvus fidelis]KAA9130170.1 DUF547 domain-containing protein [Marinihelvus fidelis]
MDRLPRSFCVLFASLVSITAVADAPRPVADMFKHADDSSTFVIDYGDVDVILGTMVIDIGRSTREKAPEQRAETGTRMKAKVKVDTASEGNRFQFEEFEDNERYQTVLSNVRYALAAMPDQVPLGAFNRNEQLAYWLNLYNITMLDELVKMYPERNLKKELTGRKSFLDDKLLTVAGQPLSLNDIQYGILPTNYPADPLVIYGLYQGIIGAPNIRKSAYRGATVRKQLADNAETFVNANRGTQARDDDFEVSSFYERNSHYFADFDADLKAHLMNFIDGEERVALQSARRLDPDIDDWTITDLYGSVANIGGSFANSKAAMLDSVSTQQPGNPIEPGSPAGPAFAQTLGNTMSASFSMPTASVMAKTLNAMRFSPDVLAQLQDLKAREEAAYLDKEGTVTVEELGEVGNRDTD